jgi:hypothetical protein
MENAYRKVDRLADKSKVRNIGTGTGRYSCGLQTKR